MYRILIDGKLAKMTRTIEEAIIAYETTQQVAKIVANNLFDVEIELKKDDELVDSVTV